MIRIRHLRKEAKLSQEELANRFGLSQQTISSYENSTREPDASMLKQLAVLFGVSVDYLLGHSDIRNLQGTLQREADAYPRLDVTGLPQEAIEQIVEYVEFIKHKYNAKEKSDRTAHCETN